MRRSAKPPCSLHRQDCLLRSELAAYLNLDHADHPETSASGNMNGLTASSEATPGLFNDPLAHDPPLSAATALLAASEVAATLPDLSLFERIITTYPPILESLLAQLPTGSVLDLAHTSRHLREFLQHYPLAWKTLSFRLSIPNIVLGSPAGVDTPSGSHLSKPFSLDKLLIQVVAPVATALRSLDLDNTAVSGLSLATHVLQPRMGTLQHLSVRGCKNVSIKYHIVPFLQLHSPAHSPFVEAGGKNMLALKSLYTYRCRHHRRRPYLPSSLVRRDSDSEPTHELIELCYELGIWTDTAWCPTPGARCFRRKDYHAGRPTPGTAEVWVPFDRLWRSGNRIGPQKEEDANQPCNGRLWEDAESGHDGEPLQGYKGEGKDLPAHLRKSHKMFVDNVKCDQCGDAILERCEQCSVRMHCMGCRKTLCASCAFNRPIPRKRAKTRHTTSTATTMALGTLAPTNPVFHYTSNPSLSLANSNANSTSRSAESNKHNRFWWAPGHSRSPNLMSEVSPTDDSDSDSDDTITNTTPPPPSHSILKLNMHWCCLEPIFSQGGGIAFLGPGLGGKGADKIRAVPLPRTADKRWEEYEFVASAGKKIAFDGHGQLDDLLGYTNPEPLPFLSQTKDEMELQHDTSPRSLCDDCYKGRRWKVSCKACKKPICREHDFRSLKVRRCGWRDLSVEREWVKNWKNQAERSEVLKGLGSMEIPEWKGKGKDQEEIDLTAGADEIADRSVSPSSSTSSSIPAGPSSNLPTLAKLDASPLMLPIDMPLASRQRSRSFSSTLGSPGRHKTIWTTTPRDLSPSISQNVRDVRHITTRQRSAIEYRRALDAERRRRPALPTQPGHPVQWEGCGAYFCQASRPVGDSRGRCIGVMRQCGSCGVLACEDCQTNQPSCPCAYCASTYHCPVCHQKDSVRMLCRFEEEERIRRDEEERERKRCEQETEARKAADDLAYNMHEFWVGLGADEVLEEADPATPQLHAQTQVSDAPAVQTGAGTTTAPSTLDPSAVPVVQQQPPPPPPPSPPVETVNPLTFVGNNDVLENFDFDSFLPINDPGFDTGIFDFGFGSGSEMSGDLLENFDFDSFLADDTPEF